MENLLNIYEKSNELDTLKFMNIVESCAFDIDHIVTEDIDYGDDYMSNILSHNFYDNHIAPGQRHSDYETNMYNAKKAQTKSRFMDNINSMMDMIDNLIMKIVELFSKIYKRVMFILNDVKTKATIAKLKFIIKSREKFNKTIEQDTRAEFVEKICDKFNIEVHKLIMKSKNMRPAKLEASFNQLYQKTMVQLEKYTGEISETKRVTIQKAASDVLDRLKKNPDGVRRIERLTTNFARKVSTIVENDESAADKKSIMTRIIGKVTEINTKCTNFITKHPYIASDAILGVTYVGDKQAEKMIDKYYSKVLKSKIDAYDPLDDDSFYDDLFDDLFDDELY